MSSQQRLEEVFGRLEDGFYSLDFNDGTSGFVCVSNGEWTRQWSPRFESGSTKNTIRKFDVR